MSVGVICAWPESNFPIVSLSHTLNFWKMRERINKTIKHTWHDQWKANGVLLNSSSVNMLTITSSFINNSLWKTDIFEFQQTSSCFGVLIVYFVLFRRCWLCFVSTIYAMGLGDRALNRLIYAFCAMGWTVSSQIYERKNKSELPLGYDSISFLPYTVVSALL